LNEQKKMDSQATPRREGDEETGFRLEALRWVHQALSDFDQAIATGRTQTAKQLLRRIQDVLLTPAGPSCSKPAR
jgi:hypothetical protein